MQSGTFPNWVYTNKQDEVTSGIDRLRKQFYSCRFEVDWSALPASLAGAQDQGLVNFFLDDQPLEYDASCLHGGGWDWLDDNTIQLCPTTCDVLTDQTILSGVAIEASYGCESIVENIE